MRKSVAPIIASLVLFIGLSAFAEEPTPVTEEPSLLITTDPDAVEKSGLSLEAKDVSANEEVKLNYDPSQIPEDGESKSRETWMKEMTAEIKAGEDNSKIQIPMAPNTEHQLEKLNNLSEADLNTFLKKKTKFLTVFSKTLGFFRLKPKYINKAMKEINLKFYESYKAVARSNSIGVPVMFSVSAGLALPQKIAEKLRETRYGKFIPKSGGFYYLIGLGGAVNRTVSDNGKASWTFELFMDLEKLQKTLTGIVEVSAAATLGVVYENREGKFASQSNTTAYGGASGVYRTGESQFGWAASMGVSIPPGIGAFLVYTDTTTRVYLLRFDSTKKFYEKGFVTIPALEMIKDFADLYFKATKATISRKVRGAKSCGEVLL